MQNSRGQSQEEVEYLKEADPNKSFDETFSIKKETHQIYARTMTRSLKTPTKIIEGWIQKLKDMVGKPLQDAEKDYF